MEVVLGFDTSCYTTSAAAVDREGRVLVSQRMLLPVESGKRGLRQSEAVFAHVRQLPLVIRALRERLNALSPEICAVAASSAPTEGEGSYMPVFLAGLGQAQGLGSLLGAPCYTCSHQQGHIVAGQLGNPPLGERFVALHLSGGTTELLLSAQGRLTLLGGSLDLQAGQLVDRVGVALGLPFPAGPELEKLALACPEPSAALLPVSFEKNGLGCHLSGAETQCQRWIVTGAFSPQRIALEVFDFLARTVARLLEAGCRKGDRSQALVVGGVASSLLLRELLTRRLGKRKSGLTVVFGKPEFSADNAAGVALLGARQHWGI